MDFNYCQVNSKWVKHEFGIEFYVVRFNVYVHFSFVSHLFKKITVCEKVDFRHFLFLILEFPSPKYYSLS